MAHPLSSLPENTVSSADAAPPENAVCSENASSADDVPPAVSAGRQADQPPLFETRRLRLRPWRDSDAPGPGEGPDRDSLRFMPDGAQPGPQDFPAWLARRRRDMDAGADLHWCIADRASDVMLGNVQIFRMGPVADRFQGELGYWLRPGARGCGIIGEALVPILGHAFASTESGGLALIRVHAATDSDNDASATILRSAGFVQWGAEHKAWRRTDGTLSDGMYFELLVRDLAASGRLAATGSRSPILEPVTLEGNGIRLRAWRHTDAERVRQACSDELTQH